MLDTPCSEGAWEYWLPTPFVSFPFTSPPVRHRVPSGFNWTLPLTWCSDWDTGRMSSHSNHTVPENHPNSSSSWRWLFYKWQRGRGVEQYSNSSTLLQWTTRTTSPLPSNMVYYINSCNSNLEQPLGRTRSVASSRNGSCLSSSCRLEVSRGRKRSKRRLPYAIRDKWQLREPPLTDTKSKIITHALLCWFVQRRLISRRRVKDTEARGCGHLKVLCQSSLGGRQRPVFGTQALRNTKQ